MSKIMVLLCMVCMMWSCLAAVMPVSANGDDAPKPVKFYDTDPGYEPPPASIESNFARFVRSSCAGAVGGAALGYVATGSRSGMVAGAFGGAVMGKEVFLLKYWFGK